MIQITKTTDLLRAEPISNQILKYGIDNVNIEITKYVNKCLSGLNIEISNDKLQILIDDIVDVYKWDSIEDIQICLKNGRQGNYGKVYGNLNMIIIREWMSNHLEQKAIERESQYKEIKHDFKTREEYENAIKIGARNQKERKGPIDETDYNNFKMKYEASKRNDNSR